VRFKCMILGAKGLIVPFYSDPSNSNDFVSFMGNSGVSV
jgi:hypothetical protein